MPRIELPCAATSTWGRDHPRSTEITRDHPRSPEITSTLGPHGELVSLRARATATERPTRGVLVISGTLGYSRE